MLELPHPRMHRAIVPLKLKPRAEGRDGKLVLKGVATEARDQFEPGNSKVDGTGDEAGPFPHNFAAVLPSCMSSPGTQ